MAWPHVVMVGTSLDSPGGMTAVVQSYRESGLFERWKVRYIASFTRPGWRAQLGTFSSAWVQFIVSLLGRQVRLAHLHSASRGSFWRKSLMALTAMSLRVPYVFHVHSGEFGSFYDDECSSPKKAYIRFILRHAAGVIALSPQMRSLLLRIEPAANVQVVTNPVRVPAETVAVREQPHRVLFLGRLREKKGVFDLVRALPVGLAAHPNVTVMIAGDGDLEGVNRLAATLAVAERVETPGWIDGRAKDEALADADLLVLPSYFEGVPVCVLEAMAVGVPVIATPVGGTAYVLDDGNCGLLVAPGDVAALGAGIHQLLESASLRRAMAARARARAEQEFSSAAVARALETFWARCCAPESAAHEVGGN